MAMQTGADSLSRGHAIGGGARHTRFSGNAPRHRSDIRRARIYMHNAPINTTINTGMSRAKSE
jgi:hypothetical protein